MALCNMNLLCLNIKYIGLFMKNSLKMPPKHTCKPHITPSSYVYVKRPGPKAKKGTEAPATSAKTRTERKCSNLMLHDWMTVFIH